jgi:hypothetical protein
MFGRKRKPSTQAVRLDWDEVELIRRDRAMKGILDDRGFEPYGTVRLSSEEQELIRQHRARKYAEAEYENEQYELRRRLRLPVLDRSHTDPPEAEEAPKEPEELLAGRLKPEALEAWKQAKKLKRENRRRSWEDIAADVRVGYGVKQLQRWRNMEQEITGQKWT